MHVNYAIRTYKRVGYLSRIGNYYLGSLGWDLQRCLRTWLSQVARHDPPGIADDPHDDGSYRGSNGRIKRR
jgi:hypothetical protein